MIQRFGKYIGLSSPGLHAKIPFGIDRATPIKVEKIFKEEFGVRTIRPGVRTEYSPRQYLEESLMLTGDLNILDVRWIMQFKIKDPVKLLFAVRDPQDAEFYSFLKTLETYKNTIDENSTIILTTDSDYYKYLKGLK